MSEGIHQTLIPFPTIKISIFIYMYYFHFGIFREAKSQMVYVLENMGEQGKTTCLIKDYKGDFSCFSFISSIFGHNLIF